MMITPQNKLETLIISLHNDDIDLVSSSSSSSKKVDDLPLCLHWKGKQNENEKNEKGNGYLFSFY